MKLADDAAKYIQESAQRFQAKVTQMAAQYAEDSGRDDLALGDVDFALTMLLKDATKLWKD